MNSRERIIKALNHEEPDRVPIDLGGSSVSLIHQHAHTKLARSMGLENPRDEIQNLMTMQVFPDERILERFKSDVRVIQPGKPDKWDLKIDDDTKKWEDEWGVVYTKPEGVMYYEWDAQPLSDVNDIPGLKNYAWPDPTDPGRYRGIREKVKALFDTTDSALLINGPYGIWEQTLTMRGVQNALMDLAANQKLAEYLADMLLDWLLEYWDRMLALIGEYVQVVKIDDDLGYTNGPLMSPETYRKIYKPRHIQLVDFIKKRTNAKIFIHSDGSVYDFLHDFVEIGIDIINPVEVTAKNMDSALLKREFGNDLSFWGGACDNTILERGTAKEVEDEAAQRIRDFAPGGGFVFASIHCIQPFVPTGNITALFDSALKYGNYPIT